VIVTVSGQTRRLAERNPVDLDPSDPFGQGPLRVRTDRARRLVGPGMGSTTPGAGGWGNDPTTCVLRRLRLSAGL
jgi:hypothetical protein